MRANSRQERSLVRESGCTSSILRSIFRVGPTSVSFPPAHYLSQAVVDSAVSGHSIERLPYEILSSGGRGKRRFLLGEKRISEGWRRIRRGTETSSGMEKLFFWDEEGFSVRRGNSMLNSPDKFSCP